MKEPPASALHYRCPHCGKPTVMENVHWKQREVVRVCVAPSCNYIERRSIGTKEFAHWHNHPAVGWWKDDK